MAALKNPRHELFVQHLAKGKSQIEAYTLAGYKPHDGNAATLFGKPDIQSRLAEMAERVATKTELTVATITDRLLRIADVAEATGVFKAENGDITESSPKHLSVARNALMDAAKLNGLVVDKSEVEHSGGVTLNVTPEDAAL